MSKNSTKSTIRKRTGRIRTINRAVKSAPHDVLVRNGRTTHVIVPVDEYERLVLLDMGRDAARNLDDPDDAFADADQLGLELAGKRIAEARKAKGLTQKALGDKLHLPQSQISRIEHNPDRSSLKTLKRIAQALNVDVRALV